MAPVRIAEQWLGRTGSLQGVLSYSGPAMTRHSTAVGGTNGGRRVGSPRTQGCGRGRARARAAGIEGGGRIRISNWQPVLFLFLEGSWRRWLWRR